MLVCIYCVDDPAVSRQIRGERLQEHLAYLEHHRDIILLGGARLAEDGQTRLGSTLILSVESLQQAVEFSAHEPFRKAGLYERVDIQRMRRAQWRPEIAPQTPDGN